MNFREVKVPVTTELASGGTGKAVDSTTPHGL